MENEHISNLFGGLHARLRKHITDRGLLKQIIFEETKIQLSENDIVVNKGVITLKLNPLKKSALAIKKEAILKRIASETTLVISDLR